MRPDIQVGARFPDYELTDHTGKRRKISELQGDDPMILVLSRGHYCPKDHRQHHQLVELYPELKVGYTKLVTISTDNLLQTNEFRDQLGAQWPFLSDPKRKVQKDPRHRRIHRPGQRPHDSAHLGARARTEDLSDLQRLLVLGPAVQRRPAPGPSGAVLEDPARLGHLRPRATGGVGAERAGAVLPLHEVAP